MTLVIAADGLDFVILGTDSRETMQDIAGNRVELNSVTKLKKITKRVGILVYGEGHICDYLVEKFKLTLSPKLKNVTEITEEFAQFCKNEAKKNEGIPEEYFPNFGFIIAGLDIKGNISSPRCFQIMSTDGFRIRLRLEHFAIAGKKIIATYIFSKKYKHNMTVENLSMLIACAIKDTGEIDGDVGGEIKMARIDETGFTEYSSDIVDNYTEESIEEPLETIEIISKEGRNSFTQ